MIDKACCLHLVINGCIQFWIAALFQLDAGKEVINEAKEQGLIFVHQFGEVHVPQHPHHYCFLGILRACPFHSSKSTQHRQDVTKTKVIVYLHGCIVSVKYSCHDIATSIVVQPAWRAGLRIVYRE